MRLLLSFVLLSCALAGSANDGTGFMAGGGTVALLKGQHPSIRLVDEKLDIVLPSGRVRVEYIFRNEGEATKVLMAFPEEGYMLEPGPFKRIGKPGQTLFGYFRSQVDGEPFKVRRVPGSPPDNGEANSYSHWWVKEVPFSKGQTRRVVNEYQGGIGWGPPWTRDRSFSYTLHTGSTWKGGRIGSLEVRIDARKLNGKEPLQLSAFGSSARREAGIWRFSRKNLKPSEDLAVTWFDGYMDFNVNGKQFPNALYATNQQPRLEVTPVRRGREVFIPEALLPGILGLQGKDVHVSGTYKLKGHRMFPARATVNSRGGKSWWSGTTLFVQLKRG